MEYTGATKLLLWNQAYYEIKHALTQLEEAPTQRTMGSNTSAKIIDLQLGMVINTLSRAISHIEELRK